MAGEDVAPFSAYPDARQMPPGQDEDGPGVYTLSLIAIAARQPALMNPYSRR